jgi:hypothetical protein
MRTSSSQKVIASLELPLIYLRAPKGRGSVYLLAGYINIENFFEFVKGTSREIRVFFKIVQKKAVFKLFFG